MRQALIKGAGLAALLAFCACAQTAVVEPPAPSHTAAAPSTPSPRAECAPAQVTLYFGEQVQSDEPVVTPLLNDFMARIRACEAAGGELRSITVAASADPGQNERASREQIQRRYERVSAALVHAGAPADKIVAGALPAGGIMGRRAEITADLY